MSTRFLRFRMNAQNVEYAKKLGIACVPLISISLLLALLVHYQGIRFKVIDSGQTFNGLYQITVLANNTLHKEKKPDVSLTPEANVKAVTIGNRLTITSTRPLRYDTEYTLQINNAVSALGTTAKPTTLKFRTAPATGYAIERTGDTDKIHRLVMQDGSIKNSPIISGRKIGHIGLSPDYIWWTSILDDRSHELHVYDKKTQKDSIIQTPNNTAIETLSASKETNTAVITLLSINQSNTQNLENDHSVYMVQADQGTVSRQSPPLDTASAALISPNGGVLIVQARDGSVYAKNTSEPDAVPLGRSRLVGPFSGDSSSVVLRSIGEASIYNIITGATSELKTVPATAAQIQTGFEPSTFLYTTIDFVQNQKGTISLYMVTDNNEPVNLFSAADTEYVGAVSSTLNLQFIAVEQFSKEAQFDDYASNTKAKGAYTAIVTDTKQVLGTVPFVGLQWE